MYDIFLIAAALVEERHGAALAERRQRGSKRTKAVADEPSGAVSYSSHRIAEPSYCITWVLCRVTSNRVMI